MGKPRYYAVAEGDITKGFVEVGELGHIDDSVLNAAAAPSINDCFNTKEECFDFSLEDPSQIEAIKNMFDWSPEISQKLIDIYNWMVKGRTDRIALGTTSGIKIEVKILKEEAAEQ